MNMSERLPGGRPINEVDEIDSKTEEPCSPNSEGFCQTHSICEYTKGQLEYLKEENMQLKRESTELKTRNDWLENRLVMISQIIQPFQSQKSG